MGVHGYTCYVCRILQGSTKQVSLFDTACDSWYIDEEWDLFVFPSDGYSPFGADIYVR